MKRVGYVKRIRSGAALLTALCLLGATGISGVFLPVQAAESDQTLAERVGAEEDQTIASEEELPYYSQIKPQYTRFPSGVRVEVGGDQYTDAEGEKPSSPESGGIYTDENTSSVTWTLTVPEEGAYAIEVTYRTPTGTAVAPQRGIRINGKQTFYEEEILQFERKWRDTEKPSVNRLGDEVRPAQEEIDTSHTKRLNDQWGKDSEPLLFPFQQGENTITLEYISQPLIIETIAVVSSKEILPYAQQQTIQSAPWGTEGCRFEAEDPTHVVYRSDSTLSISSDGDPLTTPFSATNIRLNVMGGYSFRKGGQEVCWEFVVPKAGLYQINLRALQNYSDGLPVYRTIRINEQVPFEEMLCYEIPYAKTWNSTVLQNDEGETYLFYLKEGRNTLSLSVTLGGVTTVMEQLLDAAQDLSDLIFDITMVIGQNPDPNYDYQLDLEIPDLLSRFAWIRDQVSDSREALLAVSSKESAMTNNLERIVLELDELIRKPSKIPMSMADISNNLTNLSTYSTSIQEMPLALDYIEILPPDAQVENPHSNIWQKIWVTLCNFVASFQKDYNAVSSAATGSYTGEPLNIWVSRGKEWGQILKEMVDARFTEETGIPVNVTILPSGTVTTSINPLLLAIGSGRGPDVVMGLTYNMPVEYAIRDSLLDLSACDGFEEVSQRFLPEMLVPYQFEGGVYALPETMSFRAMYIRTDIFSSLRLPVPDTWDDVYNKLLPALKQNNMQMYVPTLLDLFLYQLDGDYYTEDGLRSGLDTPQAFSAFAELCELYTDNGLPISTDFYSRFRTGEMPIGIENHNAYLQFSYAAPEIAGNWKVYPVPGHKQADGTVNRTNSGLSIDAASILSDCSDPEAAWSFLKWWTSAETQMEYTAQVEGRLGSQARWMSANTTAYESLPWSIEEKAAIRSAWNWAKETPVVRGGYYTNRHLVNAINRAVVENESPRTALEEAVEQINKELARKQTGV